MKWIQLLLPLVVLSGSAFPAQAQLFARKVRLNGMQVPELIVVVRTDTDERKRLAAIEQLRESDVKAFPDIVPNLIEVMLHDPRYTVRMEAMHSLVKIRPMTQQVGQALQQTAAHDENWRVRMQTRTQIFVNGYHGGSGNGQYVAPTVPTTNEPPLAAGTVVGQPVDVPAVPSWNTPGNLGRPLPSRPPVYNTSMPQSPLEVPKGVPPQPVPLPQTPSPSYAPAPTQQVPVQRTMPMPLPQAPPGQAPLPLPPAPTQPLPQIPPPQVQATPPVSQAVVPTEPVDTPISPPTN